MELMLTEIDSPIGPILMAETAAGVCGLFFGSERIQMKKCLEKRFGPVTFRDGDNSGASARLRRYLDGDLGALDAVTVDPGGTAFQRQVWSALREIPPGETRSYADLARAVGQASAARAVARANATNPVSIIVPCHRVVRTDGGIGGYGGGVQRKRWLLRHEGHALA